MKILHTSDWHLGLEYHQHSRIEEQGDFLAFLLETIETRDVDVLIVSGDIFDVANPPAEALSRYYRFLAELGRRGRHMAVIVGGNHDSASRLDAPRDVLGALSAVVVGGFETAARHTGGPTETPGLVVPLRNRKGEVEAVVAAVPYLHDWRLGVRDLDATADEQRHSLGDAFRGVYSRLADAASAEHPGVPLLATGHLTCLAKAGDKPTEEDAIPSEINRVGSLGALGPQIFDERYRYVALGHIHRGFPVDSARRIWYSGTPVQVSRTETADGRQMLLVDTSVATPVGGLAVEKLPVPITRRLVHLKGAWDDVLARLRGLTWAEGERPPLISVEATLAAYADNAERTLRENAPLGPGGNALVVEARVVLERDASRPLTPMDGLPDGTAIAPEEAFRFAWGLRRNGTAPPEAVMQRFLSLLDQEADADTAR